MATRRIPDPKIGGSIPSEVIHFFLLISFLFLLVQKMFFGVLSQQNEVATVGETGDKKFPRRDLNPGLVGENHIS